MKQFTLTILQLILPLASMTKAEYKEAYGIDLDDIDIEKVTIVQEEGSKNKYFVDEIKATAEGFDIYAGGKILSIGSGVSVINNAYSVENSKPIYCHPVQVRDYTSNDKFALNFLIFNNDSTPFDKTSFINLLKSAEDGRFAVTGAVALSNSIYLSPSSILYASNKLVIYGIDSAGTLHSAQSAELYFDTMVESANCLLIDGVNKIN